MGKIRKWSDYIILYLKGLAIGAADVVPGGVSGGTIAFISGVYDELLGSIKAFDFKAIKLLFTLKFGQFWKKINGNFLIILVGGIATSIFSLAKTMLYLVETYPIMMWAFFFGLIIASTYVIAKDITRWNWVSIGLIIIGLALAYVITTMAPSSTPETWWFIMFSGAVAICAMILPGISGAFILLLMGKYFFIMQAVSDMKLGIISLFVAGAIIGVVCFSHALSWLLDKYKNATVSLLAGFIAGSLIKVWPWRQALTTYTDSHGKVLPMTEKNILPSTFETVFDTDPLVWQAILCCIAGFLLIYVFDVIGSRMQKKQS